MRESLRRRTLEFERAVVGVKEEVRADRQERGLIERIGFAWFVDDVKEIEGDKAGDDPGYFLAGTISTCP